MTRVRPDTHVHRRSDHSQVGVMALLDKPAVTERPTHGVAPGSVEGVRAALFSLNRSDVRTSPAPCLVASRPD